VGRCLTKPTYFHGDGRCKIEQEEICVASGGSRLRTATGALLPHLEMGEELKFQQVFKARRTRTKERQGGDFTYLVRETTKSMVKGMGKQREKNWGYHCNLSQARTE
jgi:hypothetical protein